MGVSDGHRYRIRTVSVGHCPYSVPMSEYRQGVSDPVLQYYILLMNQSDKLQLHYL